MIPKLHYVSLVTYCDLPSKGARTRRCLDRGVFPRFSIFLWLMFGSNSRIRETFGKRSPVAPANNGPMWPCPRMDQRWSLEATAFSPAWMLCHDWNWGLTCFSHWVLGFGLYFFLFSFYMVSLLVHAQFRREIMFSHFRGAFQGWWHHLGSGFHSGNAALVSMERRGHVFRWLEDGGVWLRWDLDQHGYWCYLATGGDLWHRRIFVFRWRLWSPLQDLCHKRNGSWWLEILIGHQRRSPCVVGVILPQWRPWICLMFVNLGGFPPIEVSTNSGNICF